MAWYALGIAFASSAWILCDIYLRRYRQQMPIMEAVWPVTGLYLGPGVIWGYRRFGRSSSDRWLSGHG